MLSPSVSIKIVTVLEVAKIYSFATMLATEYHSPLACIRRETPQLQDTYPSVLRSSYGNLQSTFVHTVSDQKSEV